MRGDITMLKHLLWKTAAYSIIQKTCSKIFILALILLTVIFFDILSNNIADAEVKFEAWLEICDKPENSPDKDEAKWIKCLQKQFANFPNYNPPPKESADAIYKIWKDTIKKGKLENAMQSLKKGDFRYTSDEIRIAISSLKTGKPTIAYFISHKNGEPNATFSQSKSIKLKWDGSNIEEYELFFEGKSEKNFEWNDNSIELPADKLPKKDITFFLKAVNDFGDETYQTLTVNITNSIGTIVMWSGSKSEIPPGWALCDGKNKTPDLQGRFILGLKESEEPGQKGGSEKHTHAVDDHAHPFSGTTEKYEGGGQSGIGPRILTYTHDHTFLGKTEKSLLNIHDENHLPPYYKLAFIMYTGK